MTGVREIGAHPPSRRTPAVSRREFLGCVLAAGLGTAIGDVTSEARDIRAGARTKPAGETNPPVSEDWLSHPPYRALPRPSTRPFDEGSRAYFLAPGGNDALGNGSESKPWQTWDRASKALQPGDTLYLRGGLYFMHGKARWLTSGTARQPVTLRAYPGELPVVTTAHPEFFLDPDTSWEPVSARDGGVDLEYRSARNYALSSPVVAGRFADSYYPLFPYSRTTDFRSENEFLVEGLQNRADHPVGYWAGPGARWSSEDSRIHIRLRHTNRVWLDEEDYLAIGSDFVTNNYKGVTDPREIQLLLVGSRTEDAAIRISARHVRVLDIMFAAHFNLEVAGSHLLLDNVWSCTGENPALLSRASNTRYTDSAFRGVEAPWHNRFTSKNRSISAYTVHLIEGTDLEIDHCQITDGHDAILCTNEMPQDLDFHHNLVERNTDDALFLPPKQSSTKRIFQNIFRMNLSHLPFRDGPAMAEEPGHGTFICRNLFDMRPGTPGGPRPREEREPNEYYNGYNLRMEHADFVTYPGLYFYHNTVLARGNKRTYCQGITEKYADSIRRVYNNIFAQTDLRPQQNVRRSSGDLDFGFNLQWSFRAGSSGSWPGDVHADPKFVTWSEDWRDPHDFHLQPLSPARAAGREIPADWFDPLREMDPDHDLGAIPSAVTGTPFGPDADL